MESIFVNGPEGKIEALFETGHASPIAILCHPHPHFGGSMHDRILVALSEKLLEIGVNVLRFNYRGVGRSEGVSEGNSKEVADVKAIVDWLKLERPSTPLLLCGYSYGAALAYNAFEEISIEALVLIAPPGNYVSPRNTVFDNCLVILARQDQFVSLDEAEELFGRARAKIVVIDDDHFFVDNLNLLVSLIVDFLKEKVFGI
ncbi:MAG: hypothetical protein CMQ40_03295 [Gammaproteobacteria bacterium]|nr:hypothetical protein [Gammaproteobacteria bacterium]